MARKPRHYTLRASEVPWGRTPALLDRTQHALEDFDYQVVRQEFPALKVTPTSGNRPFAVECVKSLGLGALGQIIVQWQAEPDPYELWIVGETVSRTVREFRVPREVSVMDEEQFKERLPRPHVRASEQPVATQGARLPKAVNYYAAVQREFLNYGYRVERRPEAYEFQAVRNDKRIHVECVNDGELEPRPVRDDWLEKKRSPTDELWVVFELGAPGIERSGDIRFVSFAALSQTISSTIVDQPPRSGLAAGKGPILTALLGLMIQIQAHIAQLNAENPNSEAGKRRNSDLRSDYERLLKRIGEIERAVSALSASSTDSDLSKPANAFLNTMREWWRKRSDTILAVPASSAVFVGMAAVLQQAGALTDVSTVMAAALASGQVKPAIEAVGKALSDRKGTGKSG